MIPPLVELEKKDGSCFLELELVLVHAANAEKSLFNSENFDVDMSNYVVHNFSQPEIVFRGMYRLLKPGGHFIFSILGPRKDKSSIGACFLVVNL